MNKEDSIFAPNLQGEYSDQARRFAAVGLSTLDPKANKAEAVSERAYTMDINNNKDVKELQKLLNSFLKSTGQDTIKVDGQFGNITKNALKESKNHLSDEYKLFTKILR